MRKQVNKSRPIIMMLYKIQMQIINVLSVVMWMKMQGVVWNGIGQLIIPEVLYREKLLQPIWQVRCSYGHIWDILVENHLLVKHFTNHISSINGNQSI